METAVIIVMIIYGLSLLFIFGYSLAQLNLMVIYLRTKFRSKKISLANKEENFSPMVTIQLPVYNEIYVIERLIDSISKFDYPKDKLEIQVLDDSTDETSDFISKKVKTLSSLGFDIKHIQRSDRTGFKAGALAHGLELAKGKLITIFDSDFLPAPDFLQRMLPHLEDEKVGMVQARWEHLNQEYSLLTRLQAFALDAHFSLEQTGRNSGGYFINFNGTAGIWKRECIESSGGWQHDTLTEDLDLSYRAQMKGWKFIYAEEVGAPAELPITMNALKNQQFRWNKGAAECVRKNLPAVLKKKELGLVTKLHALFHLMNSTVFIFIMITALLSIPMLFIKENFEQFRSIFLYASFFLVSLLILSAFYFTSLSQKEKRFPRNLFHFIRIFPLFLSVSMGLALHNTLAVLQGYFGWKTPFRRTPKFNVGADNKNWKSNKYLEYTIDWVTITEGLLTLYFLSGIVAGFILKDYGLLPFHLLLVFGFGFVCYCSITHSKVNNHVQV